MPAFIDFLFSDWNPSYYLYPFSICVTDIKWIQHPRARKLHQKIAKSDHEAARRLTLNIMRWLYCDFITPLVRSMFYVTTTQFTGDKLTFFRKPLWSQIRSLAMSKLKHQFRRISPRNAAKRLQNQVLGHSRLLLVPKERGIRPIAMLCKSDKVLPKLASKTSRRLPTNRMLRQAFLSLTYEHGRQVSSCQYFGECTLYCPQITLILKLYLKKLLIALLFFSRLRLA